MAKSSAKNQVVKRQSKKAGLPPGTLVYVGNKDLAPTSIAYLDYDPSKFHEDQAANLQDCYAFKSTPTVSWINVDGIHDVRLIGKLGEHFEIHPLILEDILNARQRPKYEDLGDYHFLVMKMLDYNHEGENIESEQVCIVLGPNYVISFQERVGDVFEQIRERIRDSRGRIRKAGADYLAYALIDAVVDSYFAILEKLSDRVESIEADLFADPAENTLKQIHSIRRETIALRKAIWPLREVVGGLVRSESPIIEDTTVKYLRDVYDHTIQIIDTIESFRDTVSGMLDIYLSSISNKMNSVMKVLTIMATIFIPLTFVAGIYGMNFENMPELKWKWGYFGVWCIMVIMTFGMITYFRRRRWL